MEKAVLHTLTIILLTVTFGFAGESWEVYSEVNPLISLGTSPVFDSEDAYDCSVIKYKNTYHMWYRGQSDTQNNQIGYATSNNGEYWIKQNSGNSVISFPLGAGDAQYPRVVVDENGELRIYYRKEDNTNDEGTLWTAKSIDGINWLENKEIMSDIKTIGFLAPLYDNNKYHLWYQNEADEKIYYAVSDGGENFSSPVMINLDAGGADTWENSSIGLGCIIKISEGFQMYYMGNAHCDDMDRCFCAIGVATSANGITWNKYSDNPVFYNGTLGISNSSATFPWVIIDDNYNKLYFSSNSDDISSYNNIRIRLGIAKEKISDLNNDDKFDLKDIIYGLQILTDAR